MTVWRARERDFPNVFTGFWMPFEVAHEVVERLAVRVCLYDGDSAEVGRLRLPDPVLGKIVRGGQLPWKLERGAEWVTVGARNVGMDPCTLRRTAGARNSNRHVGQLGRAALQNGI